MSSTEPRTAPKVRHSRRIEHRVRGVVTSDGAGVKLTRLLSQPLLMATAFLAATLFLEQRPEIDGDWLARSIHTLDADSIDLLADILLDCALVVLPLHSAAVVAQINDALARLLKDVVSQDGVARQRLLLKVQSRLASGGLMNRF